MFTILFTAVGRRVELVQAFQRSFKGQNISSKIIGVDYHPQYAPACLVSDIAEKAPKVSDPEYGLRLLDICIKEKVNLLIPLYEPEFLLLEKLRAEFFYYGVQLLLSDKTTLNICSDKWLTYQFFSKIGISTPITYLSNEWLIKKRNPVFVKPRTGMGSQGTRLVHNEDDLKAALTFADDMLIQQYINGTEYTLDVLADWNGKVISAVPRERIEVRAGEVVKSRTVDRTDLIEQAMFITESLGAIGPVTLQCIDNGREVYWIEINPRFGGGVPLSIAAGVDYPYLLYKMAMGEAVEPIVGQYKKNLLMLRYDNAFYAEAP